jgi:secreted trypsin-like serine protease
MKKSRIIVIAIVFILLFSLTIPAAAVTDGEVDGNRHPNVVLLIMDIGGEPAYRCSGTMIAPTVLLTAGHCTSDYPDEPYSGMRVFYESDVQNGNNTYPYAGGPNSIEAVEWYAHPLFETAPFFVHDVGVVILSAPVPGVTVFGTLPSVNQLDAYKTQRGLNKLTFTSVGYGLQQSFPDAASWKEHNVKVRMVAYPRLIQMNVPGFTGDFSLLLSNNANTGGTCFGDSGGPNFLGDTNIVAGVTSFGINGNCAGTGGVFRMDRQDVLDFVNAYLP